ncbi:hypothetical protein BGZ61DRAFT_541676 [Ilyonectria robusta]|uniref:uncharacterized protein n=1 Tax=Ilyonectria robusta TaxID=1079257 RepID=UPI001E8CD7A1|nr:uncharacterized protein BGZ61DRAFT_541676 [Ilyonectria robusta]KAH8653042.1 hypothetical protein BGZ61DRAFT_541676 [Ilyonectria robusta]
MASLAEDRSSSGDAAGNDAASMEETGGGPDNDRNSVHKIGSSGIFGLDCRPDIADMEKLQYLVDSIGGTVTGEETCGAAWRGSAEVRHGCAAKLYIVVSRGQDFADSFDAWFLAKAFPTLFPLGKGGPRQAEECVVGAEWEAFRVKRKGQGVAWGEVELDSSWPLSRLWVQALRQPGQHATICFDRYLSMDFTKKDDSYHRRRIPWETGITVVTPLNRNRWNLNIEATIAFQRQWQAPLCIFISEHKWKDGEPTEEEALIILGHGDDNTIPMPAVFIFVPGIPVIVNHNTHQGLKLVNSAPYTAMDVVPDRGRPGHRINSNTVLYFGPPAGIVLASETTRDFRFVGMPPGTILLTPISTKIECQRKRLWQQHDVSRRGLPCAAAFACTDYKLQARTLDQVALELRGTRTTNIGGQAVPSTCDPYSLYVQLSRCRSLDGIMLLSKARERDFAGNMVPAEMAQAELKLEQLSEVTIGAESY